ncbi:MAG TPA: putative Ig domain-containing protein, partial [Candidatus Acidoferrales bacterium]|nr:putative Ig domain-containing protein [Candidatus Acidoferrales bacterium]
MTARTSCLARYLSLVASLLSFSLVAGARAPKNHSPRSSAPSITTNSSLPGGQVAVGYTSSFSASGGATPYSWSLASGSLAPGLILSGSTGTLAGLPSQSGNFSFAIRVTDSSGQTAQRSFSLAIAPSAPAAAPLGIGTTSLPSATSGQPYSATLQASGGTSPYSWSLAAGQLPAGLTLSATGQLSGTPASAGQSSFTVQVTDGSSLQQSASAALVLTVAATATLDQYGGRTNLKCANATGWFHTEKLNARWRFCTPLGNAFFMSSVYNVTPLDQTDDRGNDYATLIGKKYAGGEPVWAEATDQRLQSWGFNTIGPYSSAYVLPTSTDSSYPVDSNGLHSIPTKLPFILLARPGYYAMENNEVYLSNYTNAQLLAQPVKNMLYGASPYYTGYTPYDGEADYYDANLYTWLQKDLSSEMFWTQIKNSPYLPYLVGISTEDSDDTFGFGAGDAFATSPAGHNSANLAWLVAVVSPVQAADSRYGHVYADTTVYTKKAWRDYLAAKYGTIGALDAAWGSNYTTFDSSGSSVAGEAVGTGDGSTTAFSHTIGRLAPSRYSVQVLVNGVAVGGDTGNGALYGPQLSGTINYTSGVLAISFTAAPALGAAITVNFMQNGWGIGTGLLDEDGRLADQGWLGTDAISLSNASAGVKADMNGFLEQVAAEYFGQCRNQIKSVFPNILYLGPTTLGTWSAPSRAAVLQAAGQYLDAMSLGGQATLAPAMMDYVAQHFGDKPYFTGVYLTANPDSALNAYSQASVGSTLGTQPARGQAYYDLASGIQTTATSAGSYPYVGTIWWQYVDSW